MSVSNPANRLAARRMACSTNVELCDLSDPSNTAILSGRAWGRFLNQIRSGMFEPIRDGDVVLLRFQDELLAHVVETIRTTDEAFECFRSAAAAWRFDGLVPPPDGKAFGAWVTAEGIVSSETGSLVDQEVAHTSQEAGPPAPAAQKDTATFPAVPMAWGPRT